MTEYISALMVCLQPINLLLIIAMVSLGIVFGAIPGLSATLGIALLLPVTFGLSTETSFVLLLAIWIGGVSGTFISAVLIGIPGSSSAIATCFDGFLYRYGGFRSPGYRAFPGHCRVCPPPWAVGVFLSLFLRHHPGCFPVQGKYLQGHHGSRYRPFDGMHRHGPDQWFQPFHLWQYLLKLRHQHGCPDAGNVCNVPDHP